MSIYESDGTSGRMGDGGSLRWTKNVLRDGWRTSWENHPSRRGNGKGGVEDLSPLPRHFSVPGVGDDESRSGVRSCGWWDDTEPAVGGQTMNVHQIAGFHREACISVYQKHGRINQRLWAESSDWFAIIDPTTWEAMTVSDFDRATMLNSTARAIDGHIIGRCDEMLFRYGWNVGFETPAQSFEELREFDPSIRSAVVVHALDCRTTESHMTMASFDLDNEGMPFWERRDWQYSVPMMVPLWQAGRMMKEARRRRKVAFEEAEDMCSASGWLVTFLNKWENGIA